jgi:hypothetical protein
LFVRFFCPEFCLEITGLPLPSPFEALSIELKKLSPLSHSRAADRGVAEQLHGLLPRLPGLLTRAARACSWLPHPPEFVAPIAATRDRQLTSRRPGEPPPDLLARVANTVRLAHPHLPMAAEPAGVLRVHGFYPI